MGLSRVFDISRRSLAAYQKAMDVTSHNVANVGNSSYSRQVTNFRTETPEINANFVWGTGVTIDKIERVRNEMVDSQIRTANGNYFSNYKEAELLSQVEQVFSEPSDLGISNMLTEFFNSWSELSVTPNSMALRYNVLQNAQQLSSKVQTIYDNLNDISYTALQDFGQKTEELNTKLRQIQQLNVQIVDAGAVGLSANDVKDQRDALIDELSEIANITVVRDSNDAVNVSIGGIQAVDAAGYIEFEAKEVSGRLTIVTKEGNAKVNLTGGELYGISNVYSERIPDYIATIDDISNKLVSEVNALHSTAYTYETPPQTGLNFFEGYSEGKLKINSSILDDATKIAISVDGTDGNGDVASSIASLSDKKVLNDITLHENYGRMIAKLGNDKQTADKFAETTELVIEQLGQQKEAVSGVSIDEEMTNIIKYQRSYQASARLITIADEMLETILSMV